MENPLAHLIRRHRRFAIPLHLNPVVEQLEKRLTPDQLASIQSELSASANRAASTAQRPVVATTRGGANAASISTTLRSSVSSFSAAPSYTVGQPLANTPSSSASSAAVLSSSSIAPIPSSTSSSAVRAVPSSSSSSIISTTSTAPTSSSLPLVITRTQTPVTSISDALTSASAAAANASASSSSLSTGAVVGIVLAVLVGVVILGSACGWAYRKFATRGYKSDSRWRKLDEDVTPFPMEKDEGYNDDIYGGSAAPVIGSRRALADHAGGRPMSEYGANRAGFGAGADNYGQAGYPTHPSMGAYGVDAQGRPYTGTAGRVLAQIPYNDDQYDYAESHSPSSPPSSRQLVGPGAHAGPQLVPVAMGRPAPPRSYSDIASREDFADEPPSAGLPYGEHYEPMTARTNEWAGSAQSQPLPAKAPAPYQTNEPAAPAPYHDSPPSIAPMPLPTFAPLSPLMSGFDINRQSQPFAMYENEPARQKQLYGEVAAVAGFPEPKTPHSAGLDFTVSSHGTFDTGTTHSSFSATEHGVRLPPVPVPAVPQINAPAYTAAPYEHGRPLSPLVEVSTPSTITSTLPTASFPISSSSIGHARELNPFDRLPVPSPVTPGSRSLVAPHSAASTIPSPRYPPPSPGGMSLPGSVSDSPRRWSGNATPGQGMARRSRGESMFDGEDAYGGI